MNAPFLHPSCREPQALPDTQSARDERRIPIDRVGIRGVRQPIRVGDPGTDLQHSVALCSLDVALPAAVKGTHMSRFVALLNDWAEPFSTVTIGRFTTEMLRRLGAESGQASLVFPYFHRKLAPVSAASALLDYEVTLAARIDRGTLATTLRVVVPVTSLCPCSKEISAYGAHNQRSHVSVAVELGQPMPIPELLALCEAQASSPVYALLKRADEKHVTELAYDNPKFVEDLARDVALALEGDGRVVRYVAEVENFESIHNHSAYARIEGPLRR